MSSSSLGLASRPAHPALVLRAIGALRRYFETRGAIRHLRGLDDHQLRDLGIARRDIAALVRGR
ncbi:DUF1127 domain-containing protein [Zavarzinia compransoris]|uniref:YjiS-like domain-containing protein n=1 Tax=Zavarzinia compransoris TaxID=1264899 RepID=A0A317E344_9PROT|nr:DUF1127 domain-containing protein [Zavarzinia compransoris]PWR20590.1 hypothetical protein DKG75_11315 [Zavarzinia compransoris]TDP43764.1 uncharacterized protein DUF1127 [Zavarzinia compransoris]